MMTINTDIGLTVNTAEVGDWGKMARTFEKLQPNWTLLMHGNESYRLRPLSPRTRFIQREDANDGAKRFLPFNDDKSINRAYENPQAYYNRRTKQVNEQDYILVCNEIPSLKNPEHVKRWNEYMQEIMRLGVAGGRRFAIGTIPTGTLEPEHWRALHPTLAMIAEYDDLFVFTFTEYANGFMAAGSNATYPPHFKDAQGKEYPPDGWYKFSPTDWPKHLDLEKRQWMVGRYLDMVKSLAEAGNDSPPSVCIETGTDNVDDNVTQQWTKQLIRRAGFEEVQGWRSLLAQWANWIQTFPAPYNNFTPVSYHLLGRLWQIDVACNPYRRANGDAIVQSTLDFMWTTNKQWIKHFNTGDSEFDEFYAGYFANRDVPMFRPWKAIEEPSVSQLPLPNDSRFIEAVAQTKGINAKGYDFPRLDTKVAVEIESGDMVAHIDETGVPGWIWVRWGGKVYWVQQSDKLWFIDKKPAPPSTNPPAVDIPPDKTDDKKEPEIVTPPQNGSESVDKTPDNADADMMALIRELVAAISRQSASLERLAAALEHQTAIEELFVPLKISD